MLYIFHSFILFIYLFLRLSKPVMVFNDKLFLINKLQCASAPHIHWLATYFAN